MDRHVLFLLALFGLILILMYAGPVLISALVQILLLWAGMRTVVGEWFTGLVRGQFRQSASAGLRVFDENYDPVQQRLEQWG